MYGIQVDYCVWVLLHKLGVIMGREIKEANEHYMLIRI